MTRGSVVAENVRVIRRRMAAAMARRPAPYRDMVVQLVAASKGVPVQQVQEAVEAGVDVVAESRAQEMAEKFRLWRPPVPCHFIGPLQRNKVKVVMEWCELIQSIDSLPLAESIHLRRQQSSAGGSAIAGLRILVQVNLAGEPAKGGFAPGELRSALVQMSRWPGLAVAGLMAIPPYMAEAGAARPHFRQLRQLAEQAAGWALPGITMTTVSMGMSQDFEIAIEEGATMIRIGTALFGPRAA
jgi:PLP dependent protein